MNRDELILKKLEEMEAQQAERDAALKAQQDERDAALKAQQDERDAALKAQQDERDAALEIRLTNIETKVRDVQSEVRDVRSQVKDVLKDSADQRVNQTRLEGELHTLDSKLIGKLESLEIKIDSFIANTQEQKTDKNERWKIGGIIVSCCVAVASIILSIITSLK